MNKLPKVVIVGRMNVGKSMLFNRLAVNVKSITLDFQGVTRDFLSDIVTWQGMQFELIDTGGISLQKFDDELAEKIRQLGLRMIQDADIVIFVVDGKQGMTNEDRQINDYLYKLQKNVLLVVNKIDSPAEQDLLYEFYQLGRKQAYAISALHGRGIADLLESLIQQLRLLPEKKYQEEKPAFSVVLLGKPNVGKSSLLNLLIERERALVSAQPGTTREPITEMLHFYKETLLLTDTPGIRRKKGIKEPLETLMVKTAFKAVDRADIVLLLIDGSQGSLSDQELKLAFYVFQEQYKGLIILINKEDIVQEYEREQLEENIDRYEFMLRKVPMMHISCKTGYNIGKIIPLVHQTWQRCNQEFSSTQLTFIFKEALQQTPLYYQTKLLKVHNAKQIKKAPITIVLFVNKPEFFGQSQLNFLESVLRKHAELKGAPIKFIPRAAYKTE